MQCKMIAITSRNGAAGGRWVGGTIVVMFYVLFACELWFLVFNGSRLLRVRNWSHRD